MRLVLLGPPGAGKGTQARQIAQVHAIPHIATGDIFREHVRESTPLGLEAKAFMDRGDLVPDDVVIRMVSDRLQRDDCAVGFLLDGFPRTVPQALALERDLVGRAQPLHVVLRFLVDEAEVVARLSARHDVEHRDDDDAAVVRHRLEEYHAKTEPLEFFYAERELLRDIEAVGEVGEVTARALKVLEEFAEPAA